MYKIYFKQLGGHIHARFFVNGGLAGELCMREDEFLKFVNDFPRAQFFEEE